jgi:hypothetical protein
MKTAFLNFLLLAFFLGTPLPFLLAQDVVPVESKGSWTPSRIQQNYRNQWMAAKGNLLQRQNLAEQIGNQGAARYAAEQRYSRIHSSTTSKRAIRQGLDSIYFDRKSRNYIALERKGGTSQLKRTYGSMQGTNQNAIRSAAEMLKRETRTNKIKAFELLESARNGRLRTEAVRTPHVLGKPNAPKLIASDAQNVSREADRLLKKHLRVRPEDVELYNKGKMRYNNQLTNSSNLRKIGRRIGVVVGVGFAAYDFYKWNNGTLTNREFVIVSAEAVGSFAGGIGGAIGGAKLGGSIGLAVGPMAPVAVVILSTAGGVIGGIVGGIVGGKMSGGIANTFYNRLDETQKETVRAYVDSKYRYR